LEPSQRTGLLTIADVVLLEGALSLNLFQFSLRFIKRTIGKGRLIGVL
jgi:hypothetical protein